MAIRLPLTTVLDKNNSTIVATGPASTSGGVAYTFTVPQDCDNIVVKFQASVLGGGVSATLQTSDDGGTTWYDVSRSSTVSNANATNAEWLSAPINGVGARTGFVSGTGTPSIIVVDSVIAAPTLTITGSIYTTIGKAAASSLGQRENSGLPILSQYGRVFLQYTSAVTSVINERIKVMVNSQSATS